MGALTMSEKEALLKACGTTSSPIISTVARLFLAPPNGSWQYSGVIGACALVMDRKRNTKAIRIVDLETSELKFEEEIASNMNYNIARPTFHTFELRDAIAGLQFCDPMEAAQFGMKVKALRSPAAGSVKLQEPKKRGSSFFGRLKKRFTGEAEPSAPMQVSGPTNVKHERHIGYDPVKGFVVENLPEEWKTMFKTAGISKKELRNPDMAKDIITLVATEMGPQAVSQLASPVAPPPPTAPPPPPAPPAPAAPPPPLAVRSPSKPSITAGMECKAPFSDGELYTAVVRSVEEGDMYVVEYSDWPGEFATLNASDLVFPKGAPAPAVEASSGGGGLLDAIRAGKALKHVSAEDKAQPDAVSTDDDSGDMISKLRAKMAQIRSDTCEEEDSDSDSDWSD